MEYFKSVSKFLVAGTLFSSLFVTNTFASNLGKVTGDVVNLRSYNSTAGHLVSVVKENDILTIVDDANNGWFEVSTANKVEGFISGDYVQIVQTDATCIADDVNVRVSPSNSSESLGKAKKMQVLVTTGIAGDWCQVKFNGKTGYIHKQFMQGSLLQYLQTVTVPDTANSSTATVTEDVGQTVASKTTVTTTGTNAYATVNARSLNMRASAGMDGKILKSLPEGYNLNILSTSGDWVEVSDDEGNKGFVSSQYIDFKNGSKPANKTATNASAIVNSAIGSSTTASTGKLSNKRNYNGTIIDVNELIEYSKQFIGTPYVYGGTDLENGVDCSGFVMSVYKNFGVQLNRVSRDMYTQGTAVQKENLEPGDLLFFNTGGNSVISHVGMYIGDDQYIHSTNGAGDGVTISSLNDGYAKRTYVGARRILN